MLFVTGGTGLTGAHLLLDLLRSDKQVRALKRKNSDLLLVQKIFSWYTDQAPELFKKIEWVDGDILDVLSLEDAMNGAEQVYHCAAMVSFDPRDAKKVILTNEQGTANVVNIALEQKIKKLCHVSSIATLGRNERGGEITEETYWAESPENSIYAIGKYGAEREVWRAAEEGLQVVIVNPSIILGPGNWNSGSSNMFLTGYKGIRFYTEGVNGFVDVRDLVKVMQLLMDSDIEHERFIVSSENVSYRDFFNGIHNEFKKPLPGIKAGPFLSGLAWRMDMIKSKLTGGNPLLTKETAQAAHIKNVYSNKKIRETLNIDFIPVEQSIKDTCSLLAKDVA